MRLCLVILLLLSLLSLAAAAPPPGLTVRVEPVFGGAPLVLETQAYTTARQEVVRIRTFRFYLTAVCLTYADGSTYVEPASYHLIDADSEAGPAALTVALPDAPRKPVRGLTFCVGVDSAANVAGAQGDDLEPGRGMYWAWHSGYVNAKLEGTSPACPNPRHEFEWHIGGFGAPHATRRTVALTLPVPTVAGAPLVLRADVGAWLGGQRLADTPSVLVPGPAAVALANACARMFSLTVAAPPLPTAAHDRR